MEQVSVRVGFCGEFVDSDPGCRRAKLVDSATGTRAAPLAATVYVRSQ